jgi:hypothetical protein
MTKQNIKRSFKFTSRHRRGVSLVEVVMVLGISTLLIGGALAWFDSKKSSDFYDSVRQVESSIREAQSENVSSIVPGYNSADSNCNDIDRTGCIISQGQKVFGTAVSVAVSAANTGSPTLRVWYLKQTEPIGSPAVSHGVDDYNIRNITLPIDLRFEGYKIYAPTAAGTLCNAGSTYRNLDYDANGDGGQRFVNPASESMVVFRKVTGSYNTFWNNAGISINPSATTASRPVWFNYLSSNPGWVGSYDDMNYSYSLTNTGNLQSQPCAVLWRFGSLERKAGDATKPRFSAEINFNLVDGTTRLVTR